MSFSDQVPEEMYLYFIRCRDRIKIGRSNDPARRMQELSVYAPDPLELIAIFPNCGHYQNELHQTLKNINTNGEWFEDTKETRKAMQYVFERGVLGLDEIYHIDEWIKAMNKYLFNFVNDFPDMQDRIMDAMQQILDEARAIAEKRR